MVISKIEETFNVDVKTLWDIVANNKDFLWRSDLSRIEIINDNKFIEYTKKDFPTTFTITKKEEYKRYEFDIENSNINGHWIGIFNKVDENKTIIEFTEKINANIKLPQIMIKFVVKNQQKKYIDDLKKKVGN